MKNIKYLLVMVLSLVCFSLNVYANEEYSVTYSQEVANYEDEFLYEIIVNSNDLANDLELNASNYFWEISYVSDDYLIHSNHRYDYKLVDKNTNNPITEVDGKVEILVNHEGLKEGTKYDVYYFDSMDYPYVLDEENIGDKAEVVKIDDKLYIKLVTSVLKPFALQMEMSDEYKKEVEKVLVDDTYIFPALKPMRTIENGFDFFTIFDAFNKKNNDYIQVFPIEEYEIDKKDQHVRIEFADIKNESHIFKYKWLEKKNFPSLIDKFDQIEKIIVENTSSLDKIHEGDKGVSFEIADLNLVNYLYNNKLSENDAGEKYINSDIVNYSRELKSILKNNNFSYYFDFRAGDIQNFRNLAFGFMILEHDNILYTFDFNAGYYVKQVIYVPDDTKDNDKEYIKAAEKRIKEYLNDNNIKIEVAGLRREYIDRYGNSMEDTWNDFYDVDKLSDSYYNLTINNQVIPIVIEKNSDKIKEIEFKTKDLESDVEINSSSSSIPLDTLIEVDVIGKNHKEFKEILEILKKDDGMIFDLKLYSETLSKYITKLDNGKFKVRIPLKEEFKNKKLTAYYIGDDNKIEEYDIVVEDGYAVFETNHFSTYTIAEANVVENPETFDGIGIYFVIAIISLVGLGIVGCCLKKYRFN